MKKILEVLQFGDNDYRFDTDIDVKHNPEMVTDIVAGVAYAMATKLWGGKEDSIMAAIRALAIADLGLCVNRKQIIKLMEENAEAIARSFVEAKAQFEREGGVVHVIRPGSDKSGKHNN